MVIAEHGLDFLKGLPGNIGRILVVDTNFPVFNGKPFAAWEMSGRRARFPSGPSINESAGISGILKDGDDGADGRRFPDEIARTVAAWEQELLLIEVLKDFAGCAALKKGLKDQSDTILNFA